MASARLQTSLLTTYVDLSLARAPCCLIVKLAWGLHDVRVHLAECIL